MMFLLVSTRAKELSEFTEGLLSTGDELRCVGSAAEALDLASSSKPDLVVVDENMQGGTALELVQKLMGINAMINTAVISSLSPKDFHEESEGLGVLAQVPISPEKSDGDDLAKLFNRLVGTI